MLDKAGEDALRVILDHYDDNEELHAAGSTTAFPAYMRLSVGATLEKLKASGLLGCYGVFLGASWSVYLTPNALTYFEDKEHYMERNRPMFQKLPSNAEVLLDEILNAENAAQLLRDKFASCTSKQDAALRAIIKDLRIKGYINPQWADNVPFFVEITNSARTYAEQKAEYERQQNAAATTTYSTSENSISGSNVVFGNVANSNLSKAARQKVFVSYARKDKDYKDELCQHLKAARIKWWDDTHIKAGDKWDVEIKRALARAKIAILMVSANFFASDYIWDEEYPNLLAAAEEEGATILWVPVSTCFYKDTDIAKYQAVTDPNKPLAKRGDAERDDVYTDLVRRIKELLKALPKT